MTPRIKIVENTFWPNEEDFDIYLDNELLLSTNHLDARHLLLILQIVNVDTQYTRVSNSSINLRIIHPDYKELFEQLSDLIGLSADDYKSRRIAIPKEKQDRIYRYP